MSRKPTAIISVNNAEVQLSNLQCSQLKPENVRVNEEQESMVEVLKEVLLSLGTMGLPYAIASHVGVGLLLFKNEIAQTAARAINGDEGVKQLEAIQQSAEFQTIATATEIGLRQAAPRDAVMMYDFCEGFKEAYVKHDDPQQALEAAYVNGAGNLVARHSLWAKITAVKNILPRTTKAYYEKGVLSAAEEFIDAAAEMVPGHSIFKQHYTQRNASSALFQPVENVQSKNTAKQSYHAELHHTLSSNNGLRRRKAFRLSE